MIISDEDVIAALLKDAKKFKSKWELHTNEPTRAKPNVNFLQRTLKNVVKVNQHRMRKEQDTERVNTSSGSKEAKDLTPSSSKSPSQRSSKSKHKNLKDSKTEALFSEKSKKSRKGSKYKDTRRRSEAKKSI